MRKVKLLSIFMLLVLLLGVTLAASILLGRNQAAEAAQLIQSATQQLVIPQPGQVAHYTYEIYRRPPPAGLEPSDPYHLSYTEIWPRRQVEHTWLEISLDGRTTRWRTQLLSASGELLQDLVFDGQAEIDYFPTLGRAEVMSGTTASIFTDDRVALFKDFLARDDLARRAGLTLDGRQVMSIYTEPERFVKSDSVEAALLSFQSPFLADLQPVSRGLRIDFDPVTSVAVGIAQVVYDNSGQEHIVSYRTLSEPEILPPNDPRLDGLFKLDLPAGVVIGGDSVPVPSGATLSDLAPIAKIVNFPIYHIPEGTPGFQLASADYTVQAAEVRAPQELRAIYFAPSIGAGVRSVYLVPSGNPTAPFATVTLIQGSPDRLSQSLRATRPTWLNAQPTDFPLAGQRFPGWVLDNGKDGQHLRFVIETPQSLIYLDALGLMPDQLQSLLSQMVQINLK